jgi:iron complex outermembrane receptor protein
VEPEDIDLLGANLKAIFDFDAFSLTSITAYEGAWRDTQSNFDGNPSPTASNDLHNKVWQLQQTLDLKGSTTGERLEWWAGVFGLYESLEQDQTIFTGLTPGGFDQEQEFTQKTWSWAAYAGGRYEIFDRLYLQAGFRYNWDQKTFNLLSTPLPPPALADFFPDSLDDSNEAIWHEPTGEVILTYDVLEQVSLYAKYTRAFKSGHFNGGALFSGTLVEGVEPETNDAVEVGFKSEWLEGNVALNAAFFYYSYENYQVFQVQNTPGAFPLPQLLNAPKVTTLGVEFDLYTQPIEGMRFDLSFAILDAVFKEFEVTRSFRPVTCPDDPNTNFCDPRFETLDFTGNPLVAAPPYSITAVLSYDFVLGRLGTLTPRVDVSYRGKTFFTPGKQILAASGAVAEENDAAAQAAYGLVNANVTYRTPADGLDVAFWVRNATDEKYLVNSLDASDGLGAYLDVWGLPRTYGVTMSVNY